MSPEASAVRASAKRWNITCSMVMLYLAAYSGRSHSGESAGTLVIPSLTLTGAGSGVRTGSVWAMTAGAARAASPSGGERDGEHSSHDGTPFGSARVYAGRTKGQRHPSGGGLGRRGATNQRRAGASKAIPAAMGSARA